MASSPGANIETIKRKFIISDDSQESDVESTNESEVNLKALGDSESENDGDWPILSVIV